MEGADQIAQVLASVEPYCKLTPDEIGELAGSCRFVSLRPHEVLLGDGDEIDDAFVLVSGHLIRYLLTHEGNRVTLNSTSPTCAFASAASFEQTRHIGVIEADRATEVVAVPSEGLRSLFRRNPDFAVAVAHTLAQSSIRQTQTVLELMYPVSIRVARYLMRGMDDAGRVHLASKSILAGQMATRPETLSRALATLREQGLVQVEGRTLVVLDAEALKTYACL